MIVFGRLKVTSDPGMKSGVSVPYCPRTNSPYFPCNGFRPSYRKRQYPRHFVSKLSDADGEASETGIWLDFAKDFGYINKEEYINLINRYLKAGRMLGGMMKHT